MYRGKGQDGKRSYVIRQTVLNNYGDLDIRQNAYVGFVMFARKWCGVDFYEALADGSITLGMYDLESTYTVNNLRSSFFLNN